MYKQNILYRCNEISFVLQKDGNSDIFYNLNKLVEQIYKRSQIMNRNEDLGEYVYSPITVRTIE